MRPLLLFKQENSIVSKNISNKYDLIQDLNLHAIFDAMARGDSFIYNTSREVILDSITQPESIFYRQEILTDCIAGRTMIGNLYDIAAKTIKEVEYFREFNKPRYDRIVPASERVQKSLSLMELIIAGLEQLKALCRSKGNTFRSDGLIRFKGLLNEFVTDQFLSKAKDYIIQLNNLASEGKIVMSSGVGYGLKGTDHVLRSITSQGISQNNNGMLGKLFNSHTVYLDSTNIAESAKEISDAGLIHILRIINQFTENLLKFFDELRYESGYYAGCINLYNALSEIGIPVSFPVLNTNLAKALSFKGLYDLSMALGERRRLVANDLDADSKSLIIITGANQGGKSTFLRSIGIAQILMQCGLFVPADEFGANICDNIFTHFTKEEDAGMNSGKLDEELSRMNNIINSITPDSMLLMNESFAATTEREGSVIASDIIAALYELDIKTIFVTHMYEFGKRTFERRWEKAVFLRAQRNDDGSRTYKINQGEPLKTSYGEDLYKSIMRVG